MWWSWLWVACLRRDGGETITAPAEPRWGARSSPSVAYEEGRVRVRSPWPGGLDLGFSLLGHPPVAPSRDGRRTVYVRDGVTEWWEMVPGGLEQGFEVAHPPRGELVLEVALEGAAAEVDADGHGATLRLTAGPVFRYDGLAAWDEVGADLPARMEAAPWGVRLVVDASDAVGAVTVDPMLAVVAWSAASDQASAGFGHSVASAGDVNGDGYDDVVVGAWRYDNGQTDEGGAALYLGTAAGLSTAPAWSAQSNQASANLGHSVASAGDVNGDGYDDVVVGAHFYDHGQTDEGAAFVYLGSATGLSAAAAWSAESDQAFAYFGGSVASAGDVNGDGYDDVVVGARQYWNGNGQTWEGGAFLYLGSGVGLSATSAWTAESSQAFAYFGSSVASAGDVNGDGYDDVIVGADSFDDGEVDEGAAFLYLGSASGLSATPAWSAESDQASAHFGSSVASAGDVNGDGYDDVIVGAHGFDNGHIDEGAAFVYLGSAMGLSATPAWSAESDQASAGFGLSVASAGDVNGDGYADVVVGAHGYDNGHTDEGAVFLYLGSATGLSVAPVWNAESGQGQAEFGWSVASAGDVNGDGYDDWVVGAEDYDDRWTDEGAAFLYQGTWLPDSDGDGVLDVVDLCPSTPDPSQLDADADGVGNACDDPVLAVGTVSSGVSVSLTATAAPGEVVAFAGAVGSGAAGPCLPVIGGLCLDLGPTARPLGTAVAGADGVAMLAVTVPAVVMPNGTYSVQAAIARGVGGASSVKSAPVVVDGATMDWDADGLVDADELAYGADPRVADTDGDGLLDGDDLPPLYDPLNPDSDGDGVLDGVDACPTGSDLLDGDGDGVADDCDVCPTVADPNQADVDGDGRGDACPVLVGPMWITDSNQTDARFGSSVATAGDVNADGYADVVVGAPHFENGDAREGAAFLYLGGPTGLSGSWAWTAESNQSGAAFGSSVASAGDVNGDGYDDVVVGAPYYNNGEWDEGGAFLYSGGATGLSATPDWNVESNQDYASFGHSVASAGDVNGDGYGDVVVGAYRYDNGQFDEGAAVLYLGSAVGLSATPAWSAESNQVDARFGFSVASAGDVDGDGYDDVLVGADYYTNGESREGAAFLYLGSAAGLSATPAWSAESDQVDARLGLSVASAGDVNGDGYGDVVVGTAGSGVFLYLGSALGLSATPAWNAQSISTCLDCSVASAGDVNADGYDDVLAGESGHTNGEPYEGAAYLYLGSAMGLATTPAWTAESNQTYASFGRSVASAGDTNGDGYDDVVVGADQYDHGVAFEGAAFLYLSNGVP
ncbi:MAG: FG-GAP repeat protein [Alphaproteobacteria bacterium]|nr:FG-GAP repeat protein [Alphaproteobacteria bacterium]